jgi:hypothetical protein
MAGQRKPPLADADRWLLEQQLRAEAQAEIWRELREGTAASAPVRPERDPELFDPLGFVARAAARVALALAAAGLAALAARDSGLGGFEVWLATGATGVATLAATLMQWARPVVGAVIVVTRWALMAAVAIALIWLISVAVGSGP